MYADASTGLLRLKITKKLGGSLVPLKNRLAGVGCVEGACVIL